MKIFNKYSVIFISLFSINTSADAKTIDLSQKIIEIQKQNNTNCLPVKTTTKLKKVSNKVSFKKFSTPFVEAPNFILKASNHKTLSLYDFQGKPVILYFWNPDNNKSIEALQKIQNLGLKNKNIQVVAISPEQNKDNNSNCFDNNMNLICLNDNSNLISKGYSILNYPTVILIDSNSLIHSVIIGYKERIIESLEKNLNKISNI
jgi:peroxiredoxin